MARASEADVAHMERCLELARAFRGRTAPNPIVGCVIVDRRGRVIAEGAHRGPGTLHAEPDALAKLRGARGATLYCNLEPCVHQGRTPPCAPAVIAAGVARVVVGSADPFPGHGGGMRALRRAGIAVSRALVAECDRANLPFLTWARHGRPAFTLKAAMTLDGKIATVAGESQWITGEPARDDGHRLRDQHDAMLVGVGTVLADDPRMSARGRGQRDPIRIVLDSKLRTPLRARLLPGKRGPRTIVVASPRASAAREAALVARGAEVVRIPAGRDGRIALPALARWLAAQSILSVLVEGGGEVHASFLRADLADEVVLYVAPRAVGGPAPSWIGGAGVRALASAYALDFADVCRVGRDLRVTCVRSPAP